MLTELIPNITDKDYWLRLWQQIRLAWVLLRDRRVRKRYKLIPIVTLIYIISPLDLVPVVPVIGQYDDLILLAFAPEIIHKSGP